MLKKLNGGGKKSTGKGTWGGGAGGRRARSFCVTHERKALSYPRGGGVMKELISEVTSHIPIKKYLF